MRDILRKASKGNAKVQLNVALNYIWGSDGFSINKRKARIWYKKSALNGNPEAMFNLGTMQLHGEGGKTDLTQGLRWLKKAGNSKKKHIYLVAAPKLLSEIYRHGYYGIEKDTKEAHYWTAIYRKRKKTG
jgi:TPR repeat protein